MQTRRLTSGEPDPAASLDRGTFQDDYRSYTVRASSAVAPDSFQVITGVQQNDVVLVISGLNSGDLKATWGRFWNGLKPHAKVWLEEQAFRIFYRDRLDSAKFFRHCDG
ncbi:hypothetical protein [Glycomyces dulcitolivorans]|uniref:hypothetical protein n=1 Tax=Glycomyces dulcitolivorans TaxID=2200759 RepID=UPI0013004F27|nr:hypothetical protein [Glycomyces dulcitolivorans]